MIKQPYMERDNKTEAKRLAQRNATSYVFGSSTPRSIDLDLPALGSGLLVTPSRVTPMDDNWRRRPVSAVYYSDDINISLPDNATETTCSFTSLNQRDSYKYRSGLNSEQARACLTMSDQTVADFNAIDGTIGSAPDDVMSQSLVSLSGVFRGRRRHPELSPALPRERIFVSSTDRINREANRNHVSDSVKSTPKRAVSMTRLDQLAQPRRRHLDESIKSKNSLIALSPTRPISSMSSSTDSSEVKRRVKPLVPRKPRPLSIGSPYAVKQKVEDKDVIAYRDSRTHDKFTHPTPPMRPNRARSAGGKPRPLSLVSPDSEPNSVTPRPTPPRKPAHVKAAAMARKAIKQSSSEASLSDKAIGSSTNNMNHKTNTTESVTQQIVNQEIPVPSIEPKTTDSPRPESPNPDICDTVMPSNVANNKKEVSEEDYKKMMAEKRRLAREHAEREAEADRLRIEMQQKEEEERIRGEEEELKKLEEEQLRLIELQKQAEEERLRKAVEENRLREEEENKRKAEEQRIRIEKEEKEKKAKEEAEKQRLELEERLKRDEEERLQRKKKLEAIMSRTRKDKAPANGGGSPTASPDETPEPQLSDHSNNSTPEKVREVTKNHQNILKNEQKEEDLVIFKTNTSDITNSLANTHSKPDLVEDVNRAVLQNRKSESNGTSGLNGSHLNNNNNNNHIENLRNDQRFDDNLLDMNVVSSVSARTSHEVNPSLDQLINLSYSTPTNMEDVFNSNHVTSNAFISTNSSNMKSQEQTITDLLS